MACSRNSLGKETSRNTISLLQTTEHPIILSWLAITRHDPVEADAMMNRETAAERLSTMSQLAPADLVSSTTLGTLIYSAAVR